MADLTQTAEPVALQPAAAGPLRVGRRAISFRPGFEWVEACDLCGGTDFAERSTFPEYLCFTGEWFRLVTCRGCRLHFLNPRPGPALIGEYYPGDYAAHLDEARPLRAWQVRAGGKDAPPARALARLRLHVRQYMHWYYIPAFERGGRVLDVGCGSGKLLDTMKQLGWETHGIEPASAAVAAAQAKGHVAVVGGAEALPYEAASFDLIYMWHALEHTYSPARALAEARRCLRPGGRLVLAVPNFAGLHARVFGRYWWSSDAPRHLYQFDRTTLRAYLERAGFADVALSTRTGATSWVRGFRHTLNGTFGSRLARDPDWLLEVFEVPVVLSALASGLGGGSELRVVCRAPG